MRKVQLKARGSGAAAACVMLLGLAVFTYGAPEESPQSRYLRTARYLLTAPDELRGDFATIALGRLTDAYLEEASLARRQSDGSEEAAKLRGWSLAVERYAAQLPLLREDIQMGFPVEITLAPDSPVALIVAGRVVILGHPRPDRQRVFEREVIADFCTRHPCDRFIPAEEPPRPIPVSTAKVRPDWNFTEEGPVCSHGEIAVHFGAGVNVASARQICEQFLHEAMTLSNEIAWQRRHAVRVDWERLSIQRLPGRTGHLVELNKAGDTLLTELPILAGSRGLLDALKPWLRARQLGEAGATLDIEASLYGWDPVR